MDIANTHSNSYVNNWNVRICPGSWDNILAPNHVWTFTIHIVDFETTTTNCQRWSEGCNECQDVNRIIRNRIIDWKPHWDKEINIICCKCKKTQSMLYSTNKVKVCFWLKSVIYRHKTSYHYDIIILDWSACVNPTRLGKGGTFGSVNKSRVSLNLSNERQQISNMSTSKILELDQINEYFRLLKKAIKPWTFNVIESRIYFRNILK